MPGSWPKIRIRIRTGSKGIFTGSYISIKCRQTWRIFVFLINFNSVLLVLQKNFTLYCNRVKFHKWIFVPSVGFEPTTFYICKHLTSRQQCPYIRVEIEWMMLIKNPFKVFLCIWKRLQNHLELTLLATANQTISIKKCRQSWRILIFN